MSNNATSRVRRSTARNCVLKTDTLPNSRNKVNETAVWVVGLLLFFASVITMESQMTVLENAFIQFSMLIPLLFTVEVIYRCVKSLEEFNHLETRYENKLSSLILEVLHFNTFAVIMLVCTIFFLFIIYIKYGQSPLALWHNSMSNYFAIMASFFLIRASKLSTGNLYDSFWIENSNGLDYGSGMAHSFFHGYLKLVLPRTGDAEKNLVELMQDYESKHQVNFPTYKLFILIPKSLYCPTTLMDEKFSPSIEESSSLAEKKLTVAGVQNRSYKNSVYKIKRDNGTKTYVVAEYATPLKTFRDVVNYNGEHSNYYKKHKNDIVLQFYLTLQKVLNEHEDCTNFCELIFFDDKDENGDRYDVGRILLTRINQLQQDLQGRRK